MLHISIV